jgi:hypothetical protein
MSIECAKVFAETAKAVVETIAFGCAGWFFIWKWRSGYQVVNLTLELQCQRTARDADTDLLVVSATMRKGDRGSLEVHDAQARFTFGDQVRILSFVGFERSSFVTKSLPQSERYEINWSKRSENSPFLQLTPGESSCVSCYIDLPKKQTCFVEVAILGKQSGGKAICQWKATCVSAPPG